jgi:hypothetical protein
MFLPVVEADLYYQKLEKTNFAVMDAKHSNIPNYKLLYAMMKHARNNTF